MAGRVNTARLSIVIIVVLMAIYLVAIAQMAWGLITAGDRLWFAPLMGLALVVFPVIGVVVVIKDLRFVHHSNRLIARLDEAGELPEDDLPKLPSGRTERAAADADFARWKANVERAPNDWQNWALLALAYREAGDTARARRAMRRAIAMERTGPEPPAQPGAEMGDGVG